MFTMDPPLTDIGTAETTVGSNAPTFPAKYNHKRLHSKRLLCD